ncbi:glycoside hydrolase family 61 protein [Apiospora arundinis]|uniref:lytic cellulose monooxygenase (C4-dehydrogenating) n=1 Tax=Apiospora arundinis TaxID=335852 RepID=A0ABR2IRM6_9PEZI
MRLSIATGLAALSSRALAHGGVQEYVINDVKYPGYVWHEPYEGQSHLIQRSWHSYPITDPASSNMTCNFRGAAVADAYHAPVAAGSAISASWNEEGFGWVHTVGPLMAYMAACPSSDDGCTALSTTDIAGLDWFKIAEAGLREGHAVGDKAGWLQWDLWENQVTDHWDVVVPATLKPGKYLIRHEIINLELAPVQFYPDCAQLEVSGSGSSVPTAEYLVKFPGGYSVTDPGIAIAGRVTNDMVTKNYTVPGPKVWSG